MTLTKMGPRRHAEPRLEVVSAEPREEGIAPSGITVGTAVAEPVVVEVEASPAVGERSGEESAQAESNPQKDSSALQTTHAAKVTHNAPAT